LPTPAIGPLTMAPPVDAPKPTPLPPSLPTIEARTEPVVPSLAPNPEMLPTPPARTTSRTTDLPPAMVERSTTTPQEKVQPGAEKKLKVILYMSDERPRFEVRDGDEVYLKVVCNHVEVKSPGDKGSNLSTMSARGNVRFITPGGEGTCSELTVLPGTGSVKVSGNVNFTHNWGKLETTVSGEQLTFRLGSVTFATPTNGTSGISRTSFEKLP
jgi:hypothetical protein